MSEIIKQSIIVKDGKNFDGSRAVEHVAFFNDDGTQHPLALSISVLPVVIDSPEDEVEKIVYEAIPEDNSLVVIKFVNGNTAENVDILFDGGTADPLRLRSFVLANLSAPLENETVDINSNESRLFWCGAGNLWGIKFYYLDVIPTWSSED